MLAHKLQFQNPKGRHLKQKHLASFKPKNAKLTSITEVFNVASRNSVWHLGLSSFFHQLMAGLLHHRPNPCDHDISDMKVDMLETNGLLRGGQGPAEWHWGGSKTHPPVGRWLATAPPLWISNVIFQKMQKRVSKIFEVYPIVLVLVAL